MPEIPFIETLVGNLAPRIVGRTIRAVQLRSPSLLKSVDPPLLDAGGRTVEDVRRRGKLILIGLSGGLVLVFHLMRDGRLTLAPRGQRVTRDVALALRFEDGEEVRLVEAGPKKRAALYVRRLKEVEETEPAARLGLEPMQDALTPAALDAMLDGANLHVKRFLGMQRYLAGIGNAYSDEILWEARLSPFAPAARLTREERRRLYDAIRRVLARAVEEHRAHFGDALPMREPPILLRVHRRAGEPCLRCGAAVAAVYYSEKETYYCPVCQTRGKVYADRRLSRLLK